MLKDILLPRKIYNSPEHKMMREMIVEFIESDMMPYQEEWEENQMVPRALWTKAGSLGLLCLDMPEKYPMFWMCFCRLQRKKLIS